MVCLTFLSGRPFSDTADHSSQELRLKQFNPEAKDVQIKKVVGRGQQGVVFSVQIEGQVYAVKVFQKPCREGPESLSRQDRLTYLWPFANECRAFARLHQSSLNGIVAVKCHGWMRLSDEQLQRAQYLSKDDNLCRWSIVKDLIVADTVVEDRPSILHNIDRLYEERILVQDPRPDNFKGKYLVDLGSTRTYPHVFWNKYEEDAFYKGAKRVISRWRFEDGRFKSVVTLPGGKECVY